MATTEEDGGKVKPPGLKQSYSKDQLMEIIRCENDPIYFIEKYVKLKHPKHGSMPFRLYDYQKRLLRTYQENRKSIAMLSRQCGKALALNTRIPTPSGWTTMGDIKVGDFVLGSDGKPTRVEFTTPIMRGHDCYEIVFDNGVTIIADADHQWVVSSDFYDGTPVTVTTVEILDLMADGITPYVRMTAALQGDDQDLSVAPYALGAGALTRIPGMYLRASLDQRLDLLRGIIDTKMQVSAAGYVFEHSNTGLVDRVYELLVGLGIKVWRTNLGLRFKSNLYGLGSAFDWDDEHLNIVAVNKTYSRPVRCISVDNADHMFLCGEAMVPTHNTQTASAYLLWWAIFKKNQFILIASKDQGGADEIMERLWYAYEELPWWLKPGVRKNDVKTKMFDNGSRVVTKATTASAGRGLSVSLLYLDEFAFVRPSIASAFWTSISPTLSTGGNCIITSTPSTDEDKFANIWFNARMSAYSDHWEDKMAKKYAIPQDDEEPYETIYESDEAREAMATLNFLNEDEEEDREEGFTSFHANWTSVPEKIDEDGNVVAFRGEKFKREQMKSGLSAEAWASEFDCSFVSAEATLISGAKLASLRSTIREPRFVDKWNCRWYEHILPATPYAVVMDPSGDGIGDDAAIQVWEIPSMRQVAEWNDAVADQAEQTRMLSRVLRRIHALQNNHPDHNGINDIYYSVERNGVGIGVIRSIEAEDESRFPGYMIDSTETSMTVRGEKRGATGISKYRGLVTTNSTKRRYASDLKQFIERNLFLVRSKFLASQLKNFVKTGNSWKAKEGTKDDLVMSCILMCHMIDELRYQEPDLDDYIRPEMDDYDPDDPEHPDNVVMLPMRN